MTLGGRCTNADGKGYRAGVAARVGGSVRLDKGQGNFWGFTAFGGQDRVTAFQRSIAVFDGIVRCHIGCADQRGGKGTVDGHLQRFVGGQGDVFGRNGCRGVCSIAQFHRGRDGHGVGNFWLTAVGAFAAFIIVVQCVVGLIAVPALAGAALGVQQRDLRVRSSGDEVLSFNNSIFDAVTQVFWTNRHCYIL